MNRFISTLIWVVLFSSNLISSSVPELLSKDASYLYDMGSIGVQGVQTRLKRNVRFESK